jgi:hypothetical protein
MAFFKVPASGQRLLLLFGGQINGTDTNDLGAVSNEMLAIDVERKRWWVLDITGGQVTARVDSLLVVIGKQLFIFGGKNYVGGHFNWVNSYSIASFADDGQITWDACDIPLPPNIQAIGVCCGAVVIQDGDTSKILLTVGETNIDTMEAAEAVRVLISLVDLDV